MHKEILQVLYWINKDIPTWLKEFDTVDEVLEMISKRLGWQ
jgi:hypothetical protein